MTNQTLLEIYTQGITLNCDYDKAFAYLADPMNQAEWAVHFVKEVRRSGKGYIAVTGFGEMPLRIEADKKSGAIDIFFGDGDPFYSRLVAFDGSCEYTVNLRQPLEMPGEAWEVGKKNMAEELLVLKQNLNA